MPNERSPEIENFDNLQFCCKKSQISLPVHHRFFKGFQELRNISLIYGRSEIIGQSYSDIKNHFKMCT